MILLYGRIAVNNYNKVSKCDLVREKATKNLLVLVK